MLELPVVIVPYDEAWPALFEREKVRVLESAKDIVTVVEHFGSTSVPGLSAKPIVDMMGGIPPGISVDRCIDPIVELGYEYLPDYEDEMPYRRLFILETETERTHHLHVVNLDHDFWVRHLLFRDYLRDHYQAMRDYQLLKVNLARKFCWDRDGYTDAKSEFITHVEDLARHGQPYKPPDHKP